MNTLNKLTHYMGNRKKLFPVAIILSAVSELAGIAPYILIWLIMRVLLAGSPVQANGNIAAYALWTGIAAVGSVALYFASLACSHLVAFRVETNIRKESMAKVVAMPLGFFDTTTSGRIRKVIDDNAGVTHSFVAHQMPDLAGTVLVPVASIVLIMFFNSRLGLACLIPVAISMAIMGHTMNTRGREFMAAYMNLLEKMNTEAVEYVRGIPVVKVFQQTVYSFKNFYNVIMEYKHTASRYTGLWQLPMSLYTVVVNSFVFALIPVAILLATGGESLTGVMLDMLLFILITPVFSQSIMRSMYIGQAVGQAAEAIDRLDSMLAFRPLAGMQGRPQHKPGPAGKLPAVAPRLGRVMPNTTTPVGHGLQILQAMAHRSMPRRVPGDACQALGRCTSPERSNTSRTLFISRNDVPPPTAKLPLRCAILSSMLR